MRNCIVFGTPSTNDVVHRSTNLGAGPCALKVHHGHSMTFDTASPATEPIRLTDLPVRHEVRIALATDIVITLLTVIAMISRRLRQNGVSTKLTLGISRRESNVAILFQMRQSHEKQFRGICMASSHGIEMRYRLQRMRAMTTLLYADRAETPCAFEAEVAVPVAIVREREAGFTESAFF